MTDDQAPMSPDAQDAPRETQEDAFETDASADSQLTESGRIPWRSTWQLPVALTSLLLIGVGFWTIRQGTAEPDPNVLLTIGAQRLAEGRLDEAASFADRAAPLLDDSDAVGRGRLYALQGDLEARRSRSERAHAQVLALYEQAQLQGHALTPEQEARRAAALASLKRYEAAFAHLMGTSGEALDPVAEGVRYRVLQALVEEAQAGDPSLRTQLVPVLDSYSAAHGRQVDRCAWALIAAARLRLDSGDAEAGIEYLMRGMRRVDAREDLTSEALGAEELGSEVEGLQTEWLGRMYGTLGRLWVALDDRDAARNALDIALQSLAPGDEERRRAEAAMAWIEFADGNFGDAIARFEAVLAANPSAMTQMEVRLWRAEAYAVLGEYDQSVTDYRTLLEIVPDGVHPLAKRVIVSLSDRVRESFHRSDSEQAIQFGELMLGSEHVEPDQALLQYTANAHYAQGSLLLGGGDSDDLHAVGPEHVTADERRAANTHFKRAGTLYSMLGALLQGDEGQQALWNRAQASAAESFDLGADRTSAIAAYVAYLDATDERDLQRARMAFRYARVLHSAFRFEEALAAYDALIERHGGGAYAAAAHVGSAQCLVRLSRSQEARARLEAIVSGAAGIRPEAIEYQEAMFELGTLLWGMDAFADAAKVLDEAVRRYPEDGRRAQSAYMLAESHRVLADQSRTRGEKEFQTPSQQKVSAQEQAHHLREAATAFESVVLTYRERDPASLSALEEEMLREASVSNADAVFRLGEYEACVELLEEIERRYRTEATSLEALIRLVEVYDALGSQEMAEKAHRRSELRLRQLPDDAFEFPGSQFDRDAWRKWLERRPMRGVRHLVQE